MLDAVVDLSQQVHDLPDALLSRLQKQPSLAQKVVEEAAGIPQWDVWKTIQNECRSFDANLIQLILVGGSVPDASLGHVALFRQIVWKAVINVDPDSENRGFYKAFNVAGGKQQLFEMWIPERIRDLKNADLAGQIDWKKIPWLFANGRLTDTKPNLPKEFKAWRASWLNPIGRFLEALIEQLDKQKPVATVIMPFKGADALMIKTLVQRLDEGLSANKFTAKHVLINTEEADMPIVEDDLSIDLTVCRIPSNLLCLGLVTCLGCAQSRSYLLPSAVKDAKVSLKEQEYLYLRECLHPLYEQCELENVDEDLSEEEMDEVLRHHQEAFLSGQQISLLSLRYDHDARRTLVDSLRSDIQKQLERQAVSTATPTVIELLHKPGTGGSTIARRILWELHRTYPCAIVREGVAGRILSSDEEERCFSDISIRISTIEEITSAAPLILIDGESGFFRRQGSSRRIAEMLMSRGKKKAVILHCLRGNDFSKTASPLSGKVDVKLSPEDRKKFEQKYSHLLSNTVKGLSRTFHFPLWAFLEEFKPRLEKIVSSSIETFSESDRQIIRFVALMQRFAGRSVPPALVYILFLRRGNESHGPPGWQQNSLYGLRSPTYDEIYRMLSESIKSLLVQNKREAGFSYDLHHVLVADTVLRRLLGGKDGGNTLTLLPRYIKELLDLLERELVEPDYVDLFEDLFLHNKDGDSSLKFSVLVETLKRTVSDYDEVGALLSRAASFFRMYRFYSHLSRFYIYSLNYDPPQYGKALETIAKGFEVCKTGGERMQLWDARGLVHRFQLQRAIRSGEIDSVGRLEEMASLALKAYGNAVTSPPSWPNPFVGMVQVYMHCIDWMLKNKCNGEAAFLLQYLTTSSPPCFKGCLSQCFYLIQIVQRITATQSLMDTEHTVSLINECKAKLCFMESAGSTRRKNVSASTSLASSESIVKQCQELMSRQRGLQSGRSEISNEKEWKRCHIQLIMNHPDFKLEKLPAAQLRFLIKLLLELVDQHKEVYFIPMLFKVGSHLKSDSANNFITLDRCIHLASIWQQHKRDSYDPDPFTWFHLYMFYFLKILDDDALNFGTKYFEAVNKCRDLSQNNTNRLKPYFYLGKGTGLSALVYRRALKLPSDESQLEGFWQKESRGQLKELKGRIKVRSGARKKTYVFIELVQGPGVEIYAGRMGEPGRDFQTDQQVTFVLSFHFRGPTAHGVVLL